MPEVNRQQGAAFGAPEITSPGQGDEPKVQPKQQSVRSVLRKSLAGGGKMGIFLAIGVIGVILVIVLIHSAPKKRPAAKAGPQQRQEQQKPLQTGSLVTDRAQPQQQGLNPGEEQMTPDKIQKTTQMGPHPQGNAADRNTAAGNGAQNKSESLGQVPAFTPPPVPGSGNGQWTPPAYGSATGAGSAETARVVSTARRDALTKSSVTYVVAPPSQATLAGKEAGTNQESEDATKNLGYQIGYHLSTHLETVATTAVSAPVIAVVDFDYQRNGRTIVPAGSRLIGSIGASSATGIVNLHFTSIRMPNGNTVSVSAVGLNHQLMPLKGIVTGRHVIQQFLLASLGGLGSAAATFAGSNVNGQLTEADTMKSRAASSMGSSIDNQISTVQQSVSQSLVVTLPAGTQVEAMFTSQAANPQVAKDSATTGQ
jgi:hypothetical protein